MGSFVSRLIRFHVFDKRASLSKGSIAAGPRNGLVSRR